ncbi:hypothetical protein ABZ914_07000 [Spirillospora sp. NPDC046719]
MAELIAEHLPLVSVTRTGASLAFGRDEERLSRRWRHGRDAGGASSASSSTYGTSVSELGAGVQQIGPWLVVEVTGEQDLVTALGLLARVGKLIALTTSPCIALEMSGGTFCDSSAINAVVRLWKRAT